MFLAESVEPQEIAGITVLGPDLFARDEEGRPLSPIASIFPEFSLLVTGRGIHAMQVQTAVEYLRQKKCTIYGSDLSPKEEEEIFASAVSLVVWEGKVLIRSCPEDMVRVFAADDMLQRILPKEDIQFTGIHLNEVRKQLRGRGESWRISPAPRSPDEIAQFILAARVNVDSVLTYYQNPMSGARFLTFQEFLRLKPLLRKDRKQALKAFKEIIELSTLRNSEGVSELNFFLPEGKQISTEKLRELTRYLGESSEYEEIEKAEEIFDQFSDEFFMAAGDGLTADGLEYPAWRATMFCRLYDISEKVVEEWTLGLSPEFHLNVRWLPGVRLTDGKQIFEQNVEFRVRNLISYFLENHPGIASINVGRVESSQTGRDRTGEEREVYLIVLGWSEGHEEIRLVRLMKWDVVHRLKQGMSRSQAIEDTIRYRNYIFDRLKAASMLGVPILSYSEIHFEEEIPGVGKIPVFFFDRPYVPGIVTDKLPLAYYARSEFLSRLAYLLGKAAAASITLGRTCIRTGRLFFDDGDEVVQLNRSGLPEDLIISETTGSFTDTTTPMIELLPKCISQFSTHLEKARARGAKIETLRQSVHDFSRGLCEEIQRMQTVLEEKGPILRSLFGTQPPEPGSVRMRWENVLARLEAADVVELHEAILTSSCLSCVMKTNVV